MVRFDTPPERVETLNDRIQPRKAWGWEEWIVNNDLYCGKRLHFTIQGGATSLHFHMRKHETMYVERGSFLITVVDPSTARRDDIAMIAGESLVIRPGTVHRISAMVLPEINGEREAVLIEFSTHHEDSDSYRVEP